MGKRLKWVDIAKGMGILIVIVGHSFNQTIIRGPIFTFHMPLFFILSGITFRMSEDAGTFARRTRRRLGHLVFPAVALFFVRSFITAALSRGTIDPFGMTQAVLYSSGVVFGPEGARIPAIGAVWFLMALFMTQTLTDGAQLLVRGAGERLAEYVLWALVSAAAVVGVRLRKYLYFSTDIALAAMFFLYFGQRFASRPARWWQGLVWAGSALAIWLPVRQYMEMAVRRYPLFPLCYVAAVSGAYFVIWLAMRLESLPGLPTELLSRLGAHSMVLYGAHYMDGLWKDVWTGGAILALPGGAVLSVVLRILADLAAMLCWIYLRKALAKLNAALDAA